jgi:C-terminal processing protease CtpA/Prc
MSINMNRKRTFAVIAALLFPVSGSSFAAPALDTGVSPDQVLSEIERVVRREFYDRDGLAAFNAAEDRIRAEAKSDVSEASNGWLLTLNASHTGRFTPDTIEYFELADVFARGLRDDLGRLFPPEGRVTYAGIGIATEAIGGKVYISDVYDGSPAAFAGLNPGDEIVSVDGKPFAPIDSFAGKVGQTVQVRLRRAAHGPMLDVGVTVRSLQPAETFNKAIRDSVRIVAQGGARIGYMRIWSFASRGVSDVIMDLLTTEPLKSADGLVLDLRGRWGGAPPDAVDYFVGRSPTMTMTGRDGEADLLSTSWRKPVIGIVDGGSRSGMEILAYALQRAGVPLIGTRTAGDVLAGRAFVLKDNSLLEIAVSDVHVDGMRLEGNGVSPDISVPFELPYTAGNDPQLDRAVEEMAKLLRRSGGNASEDG